MEIKPKISKLTINILTQKMVFKMKRRDHTNLESNYKWRPNVLEPRNWKNQQFSAKSQQGAVSCIFLQFWPGFCLRRVFIPIQKQNATENNIPVALLTERRGCCYAERSLPISVALNGLKRQLYLQSLKNVRGATGFSSVALRPFKRLNLLPIVCFRRFFNSMA